MSASTSQPPNPSSTAEETTPLINNASPVMVNPRTKTMWPWIILVSLVVIANGVVLFLLFEGIGMDTRQHFIDSYDPNSIKKHMKELNNIAKKHGGSLSIGRGFNASLDYIYNNLNSDPPCALYKQFFQVPVWELNEDPIFQMTKSKKINFELKRDFVVLPYGGKSTRIGNTRILSVDSPDCTADGYFGLKGRVAIIPHNPKCNLYQFALSAQNMGAVAIAFYTPVGQSDLLSNYTALPQKWNEGDALITVPVLSISHTVMQFLMVDEIKSRVSINLDSNLEITGSANLICHVFGKDLDDKIGNPSSVIVVGGHLDSFQSREGEENNISGASVLLEIVNAIQRARFQPFHHLYFVWFGARSFQSHGADYFLKRLEENYNHVFVRTLMYMNVEELDNEIPLVYDGSSVSPQLRNSSQFIQNLMEEHFKEDKISYELVNITEDNSRDALSFVNYGIPVGGITSGFKLGLSGLQIEKQSKVSHTATVINCAESLITTLGALSTHEKLKQFFGNE